jgi:hypothetical protein
LSGVPVACALGRAKLREILADGEARTGLACDTDLEAHIATLQHFGATRIALATRWPERVNMALTRYLAEAGIEVIVTRSRSRSLEENKYASPADDHLLALDLGAGTGDAPNAGVVDARPVVRYPCRAALRPVRLTGIAQYPIDDPGATRRASACPP